MINSTLRGVTRLESLDYLRGLAATSIMVYHLISWEYGPNPANTFLGRTGVYGVSIFYVLSGLTLQYVYSRDLKTLRSVRQFFVRRVFRIFPLLWITTIMAILIAGTKPDLSDLALNLTGLFGFIAWDTYFSAGVWSIGNELVFYSLFPFIVLAGRYRFGLWVAGGVLGGLYAYFAFVALDSATDLSAQWDLYVNPLNQAFLFFCGYLIGHLFTSTTLPSATAHGLIWGGLLMFTLWPSTANQIDLVTGWDRMVFTFLCVTICVGVFKLRQRLPHPLHLPLVVLGQISYGVYLLHPVVYQALMLVTEGSLSASATTLITATLTFALAYASYRWFEMPVNRFGRRIS